MIFPPEPGSARRVGDIANFLSGRGHRVKVVTGFPSYPQGFLYEGYKSALWKREKREEGEEIIRVPLFISTKKESPIHRILHYVSFTFSSAILGSFHARSDIVYVVTPPYFLGLSGWWISMLSGGRFVMDVQDLWPEAPISQGLIRNRLLIRLLEWLEKILYSNCSLIVVLSSVMGNQIKSKTKDVSKVVTVYNWMPRLLNHSSDDMSLRRRLGLVDQFVVLFAGNLGRAQGLDVVIDAAAILRSANEVTFALLGEGIEKSRLLARSKELNLSNVTFLDGVPESDVTSYLRMADALLITLAPAKHREATIPSKLQSYMEQGKPVLASVDGAAADIVRMAQCGLVCTAGNAEALAQAASAMRIMSPTDLSAMGRSGRDFACQHFDAETQLALIESNLTLLATRLH